MLRNPDAYSPQEYVKRTLGEEIDSQKGAKIKEEVRSLAAKLSKLGSFSYEALCKHCAFWTSKGVPLNETPIALACPFLSQGESMSAVSKRLSERFSMTPSGLRAQLGKIIHSEPSRPKPKKEPVVTQIRYSLSLGEFQLEDKIRMNILPEGMNISISGIILKLSDSEALSIRDWLISVYGL